MPLCRHALGVVVGLGFASLVGTPSFAVEHEHQGNSDRVAEAVVHIHSSKGFGSGFFVRGDGLILTNAHVVGSDEFVEVERRGGQRLRGKVLERGVHRVDLALVKVDAENTAVLPLTGYSDVDIGSWVASVGFGEGGTWDYQVGRVTDIYPRRSLRPVIVSVLTLGEGSSGAPLVDRQGRVVGIVTAALPGAEEVIFSIRADVALQSLKTLTPMCDCLVVSAPTDVRIYVDGQTAGKGPWVAIPAEPRQYDVFAVVNGTLRRARIDFPERREVDLNSTRH